MNGGLTIMREIKRNLGEHDDYNPLNLSRNYSEDELKKEYNRMRENLRKGVERIKKSGEFPDALILREAENFGAAGKYDKFQLAMKLSELESVLSANTATLTGLKEQRREVISTLQDRGFTNINKSNFADYIKFMSSTRALTLSIMRYSYNRFGQAQGVDRNKRLELFNLGQAKGITTNSLIKDFKFYISHMDEIRQLPDRKTGKKLGIKSIKKMLGK